MFDFRRTVSGLSKSHIQLHEMKYNVGLTSSLFVKLVGAKKLKRI